MSVESIGSIGPDFNRSEGRAYYTVGERVENAADLLQLAQDFGNEAFSRGRRRWVVRAQCAPQTLPWVQRSPNLEVVLPLNLVGSSQDAIVVLADNVHRSPVPEWDEVYKFWQTPNGLKTPLNRIQAVAQNGYQLVDRPRVEDIDELTEIWQPFGWGRSGVVEFTHQFNRPESGWYSGVVDARNNRLVAACKGESLRLLDTLLIEGTEYGTLPDYQNQGLCTAAVSALHAQLIRDVRDQNPLIMAEFSMTSRSDVVGRHAGMTIAGVEGVNGLTDSRQILRYNVSIADGHEPNELCLDEVSPLKGLFGEAYGNTYRNWRNFIVGMLPKTAIDQHYGPWQLDAIAEITQGRR